MGKGLLMVISGFSGVGKGTVVRRLLEKYDNYALSVSATTRAPRQGEEHGIHYFFLSDQEFEELLEKDGLIEHAGYVGHYYGTPRSFVEKNMAEGKDVILEIEMQGAMQIRQKYPQAVLVFIMPPSAQALRERLIGRETETAEQIEARLTRAKEETKGIDQYDYILVNDQVEDCVEELNALVHSCHLKAEENREFIEQITQQVKAL